MKKSIRYVSALLAACAITPSFISYGVYGEEPSSNQNSNIAVQLRYPIIESGKNFLLPYMPRLGTEPMPYMPSPKLENDYFQNVTPRGEYIFPEEKPSGNGIFDPDSTIIPTDNYARFIFLNDD